MTPAGDDRRHGVEGPADFRHAVATLTGATLRPGTELSDLPAPQRLAPYAFANAISVVDAADDEVASGRLVLLYDPAGVTAWEGTLRVVVFGSCEIDIEMAEDGLLAQVGWSWLTECLDNHGAAYTALGGTVTTTSSMRFGDIVGPPRVEELELRASWTATTTELASHMRAFADFLATSAGLPPEGISTIRDKRHPFAVKMG